MPVVLMQLVNGSLITTVLRLRAARRELAARQAEQQRVVVVEYFDAVTQPLNAVTQPLNATTRPLMGVAA
jgi:CDP-diacylglycerol---glycerol-3-phosphate 3-phosphatidyltransferase